MHWTWIGRSGRIVGFSVAASALAAAVAEAPPRAFIDGSGPGWRTLGPDDFAGVNGEPDTWTWKDGVLHCTGTPIGVMRTRRQFTNLEMVVQWRHLRTAGNSGVFVWVPEHALAALRPGVLPEYGIEVQMLDHGYREQYEKMSGKKGDWFTTHGDIFAVGKTKLTPFPPTSPDGSRSFPRKELSRGVGEWNHYCVRDRRRAAPVGQRGRSVRRNGRGPADRLPVPRGGGLAGRVQGDPDTAVAVGCGRCPVRQAPGDWPTSFLNARLNAASDS